MEIEKKQALGSCSVEKRISCETVCDSITKQVEAESEALSQKKMVLSTTTVSHVEISLSSLLIEPQKKQSLFFGGDRFIACRYGDSYMEGAELFSHEEHLLQAQNEMSLRRRTRRKSLDEDSP